MVWHDGWACTHGAGEGCGCPVGPAGARRGRRVAMEIASAPAGARERTPSRSARPGAALRGGRRARATMVRPAVPVTPPPNRDRGVRMKGKGPVDGRKEGQRVSGSPSPPPPPRPAPPFKRGAHLTCPPAFAASDAPHAHSPPASPSRLTLGPRARQALRPGHQGVPAPGPGHDGPGLPVRAEARVGRHQLRRRVHEAGDGRCRLHPGGPGRLDALHHHVWPGQMRRDEQGKRGREGEGKQSARGPIFSSFFFPAHASAWSLPFLPRRSRAAHSHTHARAHTRTHTHSLSPILLIRSTSSCATSRPRRARSRRSTWTRRPLSRRTA